MGLVALFSMFARIQFVVVRMVLLLFPPVTVLASVPVWAPICVGGNEVPGSPVSALVLVVVKGVRLPPKILPVMCKNTLISLMVRMQAWVGAPHGLEVEHIEVRIALKFVNELN